MKYLNEYRQSEAIAKVATQIDACITRPWTLMEVCGGQTHTIVKYSLQQLLPPQIELLHGPGCPVCVTPLAIIDQALAIAALPEVIFCSFGDMLRVPGSERDLLAVRAAGGDIRTVYSPLDALAIARQHPEKEVVFFAIGFETTSPATAMTAYQARALDIGNFSLLVSHFLVPPAIETICATPQSRVQGFLAAGHVCAVMGYHQYLPLAEKYQVPIVVAGFEPLDILEGIWYCVRQLEEGRCDVENQYCRAVARDGNDAAQHMLETVFIIADQEWRGIGIIPNSGLRLNSEFADFDAARKFPIDQLSSRDNSGCIGGAIMQGLQKPLDCPHYGKDCRPETPLGAPMVSSEGACAAYYRYQNLVQQSA